MGDPTPEPATSPDLVVRSPKCRVPDQWIDLDYRYDDLHATPVANLPFEVVCDRDPGVRRRGTTDASGQAHVTGLVPGPVTVTFQPDSDAVARQEAEDIRQELQKSLDSIVANIRQQTACQEQGWADTPDLMKGVIYTGAAAQGVWDGAVGFVEFMAQAAQILAQLGLEYADVWGCIVSGDIKALQAKLDRGRELADESVQTMENLFLLLSDADVRAMLYQFAEDYWNAHHSVEQVYLAGSAGSDIVIGLVLGALTGGAGAAAVAGKAIARGGQAVSHIMALLRKLIPRLKIIKTRLRFKGATRHQERYQVPVDRPNRPASPNHSANSRQTGRNGNGDPAPPVAATKVDGEPISLITGEELLEQEDFTVPGLIPLCWKRLYRTSNARNRGLGHGWTFPTCETLQIGNDAVLYQDAEGRQIELPVPAIGQFTSNSAEGLFLHREWHHLFYLKQPGQPDKLFAGEQHQSATLKLAALIDTVGNRWDCHYDPATQQIQRMSASWGTELQFDSDARGQIHRIRERTAEGFHTHACYEYSPDHDLIAVADAGGDREHFTYRHHIIIQRTLRSGFSFYFQWDDYSPRARCLRQWGDPRGADGQPTYDYRFQWEPDNRRSRSIDSNGGVREIHYNHRGQVLWETDPLGHRTQYQYDAHGRRSKTIDPLGHEHCDYYDELGNLSGHTDPAGGGFTLLYDLEHRPIAYTDAEGNTWTREYNRDGLVSQTVDAEGHTTRYFYNPQGLPEIIIDPGGHKHILAWSPTGQLLTRALADLEPIHYRYDARGRVTRSVQGEQTTGYQYNTKGDLTAIDYPDGTQAQLHYNANRQLTAYTDPLGRTTRFEYDGLAQISRRIDPSGHSLQYHYDRERNLIGLTNESGERYQLQYDANERLIREIGFDGRVQHYQYDPLGHLIAHIEGDHPDPDTRAAHTTGFERDPLGRLLHKRTPDGNDTQFTYNRNGQLTGASNPQRTLAFAYTPNGRLQAETQGQARLEHQYDPLGRRIASALPGGQQLAYQYDPLGHFTALDYNGRRLTQLLRNPQGQEIARTQGQLQAGFDYDPAGRLNRHWVQQQHSREALIQRHYHYDRAGRLAAIDDLRQGPTRYHYDPLDRLTRVEGYAREEFHFDPAGNLLDPSDRAQHGAKPTASTGKGNRLRFHGDRHFTYDARGNLIEERRGKQGKLCTKYTYNSQNQLIRVDKNGQTTHYAYDPLGRRSHKQDEFGTTEFLWNGDVLLSEQRNHREKLYLYEPDSFRPLCFIENNQCYFYHLDHLGTPRELTDWEGHIVWSVRYKAYGNVLSQQVEQVENNLRFQGQYFDEESGLHYNRHRYYDPGTGQFTQQDPIGLLGGDNNYQYAPNPITWIDPLGLSCKEDQPSRMEYLQQKYGHLTPDERRSRFDELTEANAERWVRNYEATLNQKHPELNAHFVDKHAPDIPLDPNLKQRSIDGSHPRTGQQLRRSRPQTSSQFKDWKTQMHVLNEAKTRETRGLPKYNGVDAQGNDTIEGIYPGGAGRGYKPNRRDPTHPTFNERLDGWVVRIDPTTGEPFTAYPKK
ncbi:MAG: hypothetical protein CML06_01175 [Pseudomonadales bacterium]|nr:hypothetical protein [Pseudomonadales bacterium]